MRKVIDKERLRKHSEASIRKAIDLVMGDGGVKSGRILKILRDNAKRRNKK